MSSLRFFSPPLLGAMLLVIPTISRADAACSCCAIATTPTQATSSASQSPESAGHPLRGVIVDVVADKQALLVKHDEIPGVMRAMTMLLKTDAATLASVKKGTTITATLTRRADGWWLSDVKPAANSEPAR